MMPPYFRSMNSIQVEQIRPRKLNIIFEMDKEDINIKFKNYEEARAYAAQNKKTLLILNDYVLDVTTFADHHPGGGILLRNQALKDVGEQMKFHHPLTLLMANSMIIGTFKKEIERIIQPDKPLLTQIWNLDESSYMKLIDSPHWMFVPSPRMFQMDFIEMFTHNKWYHITIMPWIFISILLYNVSSWETFNLSLTILFSGLGFFAFSLTQYVLHRYLFHSEKYLPDNRLVRYLHFLLHGIHHMLPSDPDRLVFPPFLSIIAILIGRATLVKVIPIQDPILFAFFWSFYLIGYMAYDIIHYSLHHTDTSKNPGTYFHRLQQYHNQHHYGGEEKGFGVSSQFWDIIFRTGFTKKNKEV